MWFVSYLSHFQWSYGNSLQTSGTTLVIPYVIFRLLELQFVDINMRVWCIMPVNITLTLLVTDLVIFIYLPQIMSRAQSVISLNTSTVVTPSAFDANVCCRIFVWSLNTATKSWSILKWNDGVNSFRLAFHLSPVLK